MEATATNPGPSHSPATLSLWEHLSFSGAHKLCGVLLLIFRLRGLFHLARAFGTLEWLINFKRRKRFHRALARVLGTLPPVAERMRLTRDFFMQSRCDKVFYLIVVRLDRHQAASLLSVPRLDLIDEALSRGNGVYVAMSHHGPHHVLAILMALKGYRIVTVRDRNESGLRRYMHDRFDRRYPDIAKLRVLFSDSYPRDIYRCFGEGYLVGSAMDVRRPRQQHQKTEPLTMFGEEQVFLSGPFRVALRCGASVLQGFVVPERNFRYRLDIVETLADSARASSTNEKELVAAALQKYAKNVESAVRATLCLMTRV